MTLFKSHFFGRTSSTASRMSWVIGFLVDLANTYNCLTCSSRIFGWYIMNRSFLKAPKGRSQDCSGCSLPFVRWFCGFDVAGYETLCPAGLAMGRLLRFSLRTVLVILFLDGFWKLIPQGLYSKRQIEHREGSTIIEVKPCHYPEYLVGEHDVCDTVSD